MYKDFYGFERLPFTVTPSEDFFFPGGQRRWLLETLEQAVLDGEGIVKVIGEVGTGKTTLCRLLCQRLPERVHTALVLDAKVAPAEFYDAILAEFQQKATPGLGIHNSRQQLQNHLTHIYAERRQALLLIEEAQFLSPETFEELLFLNNLESDQHKLIQILLFGQPGLDRLLEKPALHPIRDRITRQLCLPLFTHEDTGCYIQVRLDRASPGAARPSFSPEAVAKIHKMARGSLRRVNVLSHYALLHASQENAMVVGKKHVHLSQPKKPSFLPQLDRLVAQASRHIPKSFPLKTIQISLPKPPAAAFGAAGLILVSGMLPFWMDSATKVVHNPASTLTSTKAATDQPEENKDQTFAKTSPRVNHKGNHGDQAMGHIPQNEQENVVIPILKVVSRASSTLCRPKNAEKSPLSTEPLSTAMKKSACMETKVSLASADIDAKTAN